VLVVDVVAVDVVLVALVVVVVVVVGDEPADCVVGSVGSVVAVGGLLLVGGSDSGDWLGRANALGAPASSSADSPMARMPTRPRRAVVRREDLATHRVPRLAIMTRFPPCSGPVVRRRRAHLNPITAQLSVALDITQRVRRSATRSAISAPSRHSSRTTAASTAPDSWNLDDVLLASSTAIAVCRPSKEVRADAQSALQRRRRCT